MSSDTCRSCKPLGRSNRLQSLINITAANGLEQRWRQIPAALALREEFRRLRAMSEDERRQPLERRAAIDFDAEERDMLAQETTPTLYPSACARIGSIRSASNTWEHPSEEGAAREVVISLVSVWTGPAMAP